MNNLYFSNTSNYYNRKLIKHNTVQEYSPISSLLGVLFYENDGVNTSHTVNKDIEQVGDYMLVCDEYDNIQSRWFIVDEKKMANGQHKLVLRRDLLVDFKSQVENADIFVEKAIVPIGDSAIFNKENMTYNQIKKKEELLKDETGCPWLIGYYNKDSAITGSVINDEKVDIVIDGEINQWEYFNYTENEFLGEPSNVILGMHYKRNTVSVTDELSLALIGTNGSFETEKGHSSSKIYFYTKNNRYLTKSQVESAIDMDVVYLGLKTIVGYHNSQELSSFLELNGKVISYRQDGAVKYARISTSSTNKTIGEYLNADTGLFNTLANSVQNAEWFSKGTPAYKWFKYEVNTLTYKLSLTPIELGTYNYNISQNRTHTEDQPYDIFAIPYGTIFAVDGFFKNIVETSKDVAIKIASTIANRESDNLYDLQLIPYCPFDISMLFPLNVFDAKDYSYITLEDKPVGIIFNVRRSTFTKEIIKKIEAPTNNIDFKINNETKFNRLCSPNYASVFEFKPTYNMGVQKFNVDCTYKPYTPYIHVAPTFNNNGLFGGEYDDPRGLVMKGDFSIPRTTDRFAQYELQNKNYQAIFDRGISNLEVSQSVERVNQLAGVASGAIGSGIGAGILGGGPLGVGVGVASGVMGAIDYSMSERLRNETLDYRKDLFGYQMGNIKALPDTLTNIGAFNANNKLFPVLEYYECTQVERDAILNKIKFNGMKVGRIGKLADFIPHLTNNPGFNYFKGKLIKIDINENYHIVNEIANELDKGVYYESTE